MLNSLHGLVQRPILRGFVIGGALVWVAGGQVTAQMNKNGASKPSAVGLRVQVRPEARVATPNDPDFGEELVEDLVSATASGFINAGLQGGLDWISFRRDPAQGLADPYVQNVIRLKQSASAKVRVKAAAGLLRIPSPAASKPFLKEALKSDSSEAVRKSCAIALGRIGDEECRDYLRKAMKFDPSKEVRQVCSAVLAKMDGAASGVAGH